MPLSKFMPLISESQVCLCLPLQIHMLIYTYRSVPTQKVVHNPYILIPPTAVIHSVIFLFTLMIKDLLCHGKIFCITEFSDANFVVSIANISIVRDTSIKPILDRKVLEMSVPAYCTRRSFPSGAPLSTDKSIRNRVRMYIKIASSTMEAEESARSRY